MKSYIKLSVTRNLPGKSSAQKKKTAKITQK